MSQPPPQSDKKRPPALYRPPPARSTAENVETRVNGVPFGGPSGGSARSEAPQDRRSHSRGGGGGGGGAGAAAGNKGGAGDVPGRGGRKRGGSRDQTSPSEGGQARTRSAETTDRPAAPVTAEELPKRDGANGGGGRARERRMRKKKGFNGEERGEEEDGEEQSRSRSPRRRAQEEAPRRREEVGIGSLTAGMGLVRLEDVRSRVEEEVVAHLARASLMSMLYKQHKAGRGDEENEDVSSRQANDKPSRKAGPSRTASGQGTPKRGEGIKAETVNTVGRPSSRGRGGDQGTGDRLFVEKEANTTTGGVLPSSRPDVQVVDVTEVEEGPSEQERLEARFGSLCKKVMMRWESQPDVTYLAKQWPELTRIRASLAALYCKGSVEHQQPPVARRECGKLWLLYYKEIEWLQSKWRGSPPLMRERLKEVIEEAEAALGPHGALREVPSSDGGASSSMVHPKEAALLYTCLGDLARYKAKLAEAGGGDDEDSEACWADAESWYHRGLAALPSSGKCFNQLAICELRRGDQLGGAFEYLRAMTAVEPFAARENLLSLVDRVRRKAQQQKVGSNGKSTGPDLLRLNGSELGDGAVQHLLVAIHMITTRTDLDRIGAEVDGLTRHLSMLGQRTLRAGLRDDAAVERYARLLRQSTMVVLCNAWSMRDRLMTSSSSQQGEGGGAHQKEEDEEARTASLLRRPELVASLDVVWGMASVLGAEKEVTAGWEESRGGPLVLMLEWLLANEWAWRRKAASSSSPSSSSGATMTVEPRAVGFIKGVRKLLLSAPLSSSSWSAAEDGRMAIEEDGLVDGLRGFLGQDPPCTPRPPEKTEVAAHISRCRLSMRALEVMGLTVTTTTTSSNSTSQVKAVVPSSPVSGSPLATPAAPEQEEEDEVVMAMDKKEGPAVVAVSPPLAERICPTCTNVVEGGETTCEFCGYSWQGGDESSQPETGGEALATSVSNSTASPVRKVGGGGLLRGVDLSSSSTSEAGSSRGGSNKRAGKREEEWLRGFADQQQHKQQTPRSAGVRSTTGSKGEARQELVVIDAPNVAMRHGLNKKFSCRGIALAIDYYRAAGHRVVAFLPDYYLSYERVGELRRAQKADVGGVRASQLPDDIGLLQKLVESRLVIGTPPQDYDDSYSIRYALERGGYVVTNDLYRDHVKKIEDKSSKEEVKRWLKTHCISYTFVGDELVPNPDFHFVAAGADG